MTPKERPGEVTFNGTPDTVLGPDVGPGDPAPGFRAVDNDLSVCVFEPRGGTIDVLNAVPSLDTPPATVRPGPWTKNRATFRTFV